MPTRSSVVSSRVSQKLTLSSSRGNIFAQHFLNRLGPAYAALRDILDEQDTAQAAVLSDIRARFRQETFTRASILETLQQYPEIVRPIVSPHLSRCTDIAAQIRLLYISFAMKHYYSVYTPNQLMCVL